MSMEGKKKVKYKNNKKNNPFFFEVVLLGILLPQKGFDLLKHLWLSCNLIIFGSKDTRLNPD